MHQLGFGVRVTVNPTAVEGRGTTQAATTARARSNEFFANAVTATVDLRGYAAHWHVSRMSKGRSVGMNINDVLNDATPVNTINC